MSRDPKIQPRHDLEQPLGLKGEESRVLLAAGLLASTPNPGSPAGVLAFLLIGLPAVLALCEDSLLQD